MAAEVEAAAAAAGVVVVWGGQAFCDCFVCRMFWCDGDENDDVFEGLTKLAL